MLVFLKGIVVTDEGGIVLSPRFLICNKDLKLDSDNMELKERL
jgi:hypothetical protein